MSDHAVRMMVMLAAICAGAGWPAFTLGQSAAATAATTSAPSSASWPRTYSKEGASIVLYQPQVDAWKDHQKIRFRSAVAVTPMAGAQVKYGVVAVQADTPIGAFQKEVKNTEKLAGKVRKQVSDMQARAATYQQQWQREISDLSNPDLRASAQARSAKVRERYDHITQSGRDVRAAYDPYINDLKDFERYLTADMTRAAVESAAPVIEKANNDGKRLKDSIDRWIGELNSVGADITPAATMPAK